jgi:hypothetical protein
MAVALTGIKFEVPLESMFALSPSQLRYVHIVRDPFELCAATVVHHLHHGKECDDPLYSALCRKVEARLSPAAQVRSASVSRFFLRLKCCSQSWL